MEHKAAFTSNLQTLTQTLAFPSYHQHHHHGTDEGVMGRSPPPSPASRPGTVWRLLIATPAPGIFAAAAARGEVLRQLLRRTSNIKGKRNL